MAAGGAISNADHGRVRYNATSPNGDDWIPLIRLVGLLAVVLGLVIASALVVSALNTPDEADTVISVDQDMGAISPPGVVAPQDVPAALTDYYEGAEAHFATFEQIPCFCGCEEMLGHRHLGDCFIRADGSGFEAHALGCGVCLGEAAQVMEAIDSGETDPVEIRDAVVSTWGDPYYME